MGVDFSAGAEVGEGCGVDEVAFGSFELSPQAASSISSKTKHGHLILVMPGSNLGARSSMIEYCNAQATGEVLRFDGGRTFQVNVRPRRLEGAGADRLIHPCD